MLVLTDSLVRQFLVAVVFGALFGAASYRFRFLSVSGSFAAFFLAVVIYGFGGMQWTIPLLIFFITSSLLSKIEKEKKREVETTFEKTSTRDAGQVLANGGMAGILVIASFLYPHFKFWYIAYLGAIAAVTADTWGTEIGLLSNALPRSLLTFRRVAAGTSGAISFRGLAGEILGASLIATAGAVSARLTPNTRILATIIGAGIFGSLADSFLGATVQAGYRCGMCGKQTEKKIHCDYKTSLVRGYSWMNNDLVNLICALVGIVAALIL